MRIGCCVSMQAEDEWGVGYARIPALASLGFNYVELPLAQMTAMPDSAFAQDVLPRLADIPCETCNNFFPAAIKLTGPDRDMQRIRTYAEQALARAAAVGARTIVLGSGGARNLPPAYAKEDGYAEIAEALQVIAPIALQHGMTIALEPLNRMESNLLNSYQSCLYLAALSRQDNVGALADSYHLLVGNEPLSNLAACRPMHVHVAETLSRQLPHQCVTWPLRAFLASLQEAGYSARISLEGYAVGEYEASLAEAKALLTEAWDAVRQPGTAHA